MIIEVTAHHSHSSLMNKTKSDLVNLLLTYMDVNGGLRLRIAELESAIELVLENAQLGELFTMEVWSEDFKKLKSAYESENSMNGEVIGE